MLSAAGPARVAPDVVIGAALPRPGLVGAEAELVNPAGHTWVSAVGVEHVARLRALWGVWRVQEVDGGADAVARAELDEWQGFAHDIVMMKARERDACGGLLGKYEPLRMILTGDAGTGKTRTIRATVGTRRELLAERLGPEGAAAVRGVCALAAPTGCASFQLRLGAATAHRIYGVPVHYCGPLHRGSEREKNLQRKLKHARLSVLDEFSMLGRQFMGKVLYRTGEILRENMQWFGKRAVSFGGLDVVLAGHSAQIKPVGDERLWKRGAYEG